ncbi:OLC1v1022799C2 [Oldenlandia corymbosa var. corymbosa]|uniref:OLC1v1022799C2 n=1 Tax=Oldenlandia corymbosa var. corymbosa TaxID=529605 RepID=A0AAV1C1A2_OLDCO|nr:OLC1v1022799C2 [Oldenlandia corymbosa var. corymbosa]
MVFPRFPICFFLSDFWAWGACRLDFKFQPLKFLRMLMMKKFRKDQMKNCFEQQDFSSVVQVDGKNDRISNLPDCVLQYILSFLTTKEAVATGVLSRRWKHLWTGVPILDFDDSLLYSSQLNLWYPLEVSLFMNFVERVLLLRDASRIERFRLSCRVCFSPSRVHAWISAAVRHKVEELDLCLFVDDPFSLPHCILNCGSLTVLKLEMNCVLQLPCSISLPGLKIMHLGLVTFSDDKSTQRLLSCCPLLEELAVLDCEWMNLRCISISITSLKRLIIDELPDFDSNGNSQGCQIKIDARNLLLLKYSGYLTNEMHICDVSSLVKASLNIPMLCQTGNQIQFSRFLNLVHSVKHVRSLSLTNLTLEPLLLVEKMPNHLPDFHELANLELSRLLGFQAVGALIKFLEFLPKLEYLNISKAMLCKPIGLQFHFLFFI